MQNFTYLNETASFTSSVWLADLVIIGVLLAVSSYLLAALIFHKLKVEKPQGRFLSLSLEKRYGVISTYICILIGVASVTRQANGLARRLIELRELSEVGTYEESTIDKICNIVPSVGDTAISIGSGFVYLFLWFRQRVLYVHPSLKIICNKCVKFISLSILVGWFIFYIALYCNLLILVHYRFKIRVGCTVEESVFDTYTYIIVSWLVASILMQIGLLFLFVYPILKSSMWRSQQQSERNTGLLERVKKAVALASVCLATDILTIAIRAIVISRNGSIVLSIFATNLVINHLTTIACFDHWKELLWPWKFCLKNKFADNEQKNKSTSPISNDALTLSTGTHIV